MEFEEELSHKTEMRKLIEEIESATITIENHKQFFDKITQSNRTVDMQVESLQMDNSELKRVYTEQTSKDSYKDMQERGYIPIDVFNTFNSMHKILKEAYNWKSLQTKLLITLVQKISNILQDVKALDIKRDALSEMKEMTERQNELFSERQESLNNLFKDIMIAKFQSFEDRMMMLTEQNQRFTHEMIKMFVSLIEKINLKEEVKNDFKEKIEEVKKEQETQPIVRQPMQREESLDIEKPNVPELAIDELLPKKESNISDIEKDFEDFQE